MTKIMLTTFLLKKAEMSLYKCDYFNTCLIVFKIC